MEMVYIFKTVCLAALWQSVIAECHGGAIKRTTHCADDGRLPTTQECSAVFSNLSDLVTKIHSQLLSAGLLGCCHPLSKAGVCSVIFRWCAGLRALLQVKLRLLNNGAASQQQLELLHKLQQFRLAAYDARSCTDGASLTEMYEHHPDRDENGDMWFLPQTLENHPGLLTHFQCCSIESLCSGSSVSATCTPTTQDWKAKLLGRAIDSYEIHKSKATALPFGWRQWGPVTRPISLVPLPEFYDQLHHSIFQSIAAASEVSDEVANASVEFPALCLLCGAVLNAGGKARCFNHSRYNCTRSGDSAMFFLVQVRLFCIVFYCIVLYRIAFYCIVLCTQFLCIIIYLVGLFHFIVLWLAYLHIPLPIRRCSW